MQEKRSVVKLSHPRKTYGHEDSGALGQSPGNSGIWGSYQFEVNNDVEECDYWIALESVPERESVVMPEGNTIIVLSEPEYVRSYAPAYLSQYDWILTWRDDIPGTNVIHSYCLDGWWVKRTYDQLKKDSPQKTGVISIIGSDKTALEIHRQRYAFLNRLIGHFKDKIDVYGSINGAGSYCDDKYVALAPYRYSLAIEADHFPDYWTEKIADCYLCETMPLYFGCPNIGDYFPPESFVSIDLFDYRASIRSIEAAIEGNAYEKGRQQVLESKQRVLDRYQVYPHLVRILENHRKQFPVPGPRKRVQLSPATKLLEPLAGAWQDELLV
jgi:hypothetical protein